MTDRDYLWCALNLALDQEEELARLCPVCGAPRESWSVNSRFDWARYRKLKGGGDVG